MSSVERGHNARPSASGQHFLWDGNIINTMFIEAIRCGPGVLRSFMDCAGARQTMSQAVQKLNEKRRVARCLIIMIEDNGWLHRTSLCIRIHQDIQGMSITEAVENISSLLPPKSAFLQGSPTLWSMEHGHKTVHVATNDPCKNSSWIMMHKLDV